MTPYTVFGLDLSLTSTGMAWNDEGEDFSPIVITTKLKGVERLNHISTEIMKVLEWEGKNNPHVVIEGYAFAHKASRAHSLGELGGVVKHELWKAGIPVSIVPPTVRAKFATGKGNAGKSAVVSAVSARTGLIFDGAGADDKCDAWLLLEMGCHYLNGEGQFEWPKTNMEALEKAEWNAITTE